MYSAYLAVLEDSKRENPKANIKKNEMIKVKVRVCNGDKKINKKLIA
jgi:hypothetical protein